MSEAPAPSVPRAGSRRVRLLHVVRARVRRHPLGAYVTLAIVLSWSWWVPLALAGGGGSHVPGLIGPALAGVVVSGLLGGRAALGNLAARVGRWRVPVRWWAIALAPLLTGAVGVAVRAAAGGGVPSRTDLATFPGLPGVGWLGVFMVVLVVNGLGEEVGWRGVAWPTLRRRHTLAGAAGQLTLWWAVWHLPTFWLDAGLGGLSVAVIPGWLMGLAAGAVVLGWLYEQTRSSLLVVAAFHASLNMSSATVGTEGFPAAITSAAIIVAAVVLLRRDASARH